MLFAPLVFAAAVALPQVGTTARSADKIEIAGVGQRNTIACDGRAVEVAGSGHDLTFTGSCAGLRLSGTNNQITIDLAPNARLTVEGTSQTVRWRSSARPRQSVVGVGNRVVRL
ncbi:hypothetical protein SH203_01147 [Brevundimonas sp. SH203]|uniref:DUF3060 domain-containing protein n=1 Tax=Brevundimonas sp. SH203 TaxID=345167 RepID=UPI0009D12E2F|nr:DUF3060 domain-containing protein [Brevundimonas sp. SH203]GAW40747.1 hypothetical protein SH203_01147 [Brevundimonas sp. SH203]